MNLRMVGIAKFKANLVPRALFNPTSKAREKCPGDEVDSRPFSFLPSEIVKMKPCEILSRQVTIRYRNFS